MRPRNTAQNQERYPQSIILGEGVGEHTKRIWGNEVGDMKSILKWLLAVDVVE